MNTTQALVQVKRGPNGRMSRYTPPAKKAVEVKAFGSKMSAKDFLLALKEAERITGDEAYLARKVAQRFAVISFTGKWDDKLTHAESVDAAKRLAQFQVKR